MKAARVWGLARRVPPASKWWVPGDPSPGMDTAVGPCAGRGWSDWLQSLRGTGFQVVSLLEESPLLWPGGQGVRAPVGSPGAGETSGGGLETLSAAWVLGGVCRSGHHVDVCWGEPREEVRPGVTPAAKHSGTDPGENGVGGSEDPVGPQALSRSPRSSSQAGSASGSVLLAVPQAPCTSPLPCCRDNPRTSASRAGESL